MQTKLMCLQTHVGTGFVRRALAEVNCLPIISGNIGAFRRSALEKALPAAPQDGSQEHSEERPQNSLQGPFLKGFIGEDLELTWRIHRAGYRVGFAPRAIVLAEVPSTIKGLWKQRVRWARGFLKTVGLHKDMFFNFKYGLIGLYLPLNFFNQVISPVLQLSLLLILIILMLTGHSPVALYITNIVVWLGLGSALISTIYAIALDWAWKDLRFIFAFPLWLPYSIFMNVIMIDAIIQELRGKSADWNKLDRTGVVSRKEV